MSVVQTNLKKDRTDNSTRYKVNQFSANTVNVLKTNPESIKTLLTEFKKSKSDKSF